MYISFNWLKDYVDLKNIDINDLCSQFTVKTAEIEDVTVKGSDIDKVVVGKIIEVRKKPDIGKNVIVKVDIGREVLQTVCTAPNVRKDIYVPCALAGGKLFHGSEIKKTTIKGVQSECILCSSFELGISDRHEELLELDGEPEIGKDIKTILGIDDYVIDIDNKSLTNRPDLWGHYGIAREVAAIYGKKLKPLSLFDSSQVKELEPLDIDILDADKCFRYAGIRIDNINTTPISINMQIRLYYCGMRSLSPIVDLTNYIMMEIGQPMHAFDQKYISNIRVNSTEKQILFKTLDNIERKIPKDVLLIYNDTEPVAIAGIMGGASTEVSAQTYAIILESANFCGTSVRKAMTSIGLRTEASSRFEKSLDPHYTKTSIKRFIFLLRQIMPDIKITSCLTDINKRPSKPIKIEVDKEYIDNYIGKSIDRDRIISILESLEFIVTCNDDKFTIDVPSHRATKDISGKVDIIEEIARLYGYDNIEPKSIKTDLTPLHYDNALLAERKIKEILAEKYVFHEVHSYIWYNQKFNEKIGIKTKKALKLLNPTASEMGTLRESLIPVLLNFTKLNSNYNSAFNIFEMGSVFNHSDTDISCNERRVLGLLAADEDKPVNELFFRLKGIVTYLIKLIKNIEIGYTAMGEYNMSEWIHPSVACEFHYGNKVYGYLSALHPSMNTFFDSKLNIVVAELDVTVLPGISENIIKYTEPSRFPVTTLRFNFIIDREIQFSTVNDYLKKFQNKFFVGVKFIEEYTGKGIERNKKSIIFQCILESREKTLTSENIMEFSDSLVDYMRNQGYELKL